MVDWLLVLPGQFKFNLIKWPVIVGSWLILPLSRPVTNVKKKKKIIISETPYETNHLKLLAHTF